MSHFFAFIYFSTIFPFPYELHKDTNISFPSITEKGMMKQMMAKEFAEEITFTLFFFTLLKFCKKLLRDPWMRKPYSKAKSYSLRGVLFPDPLAAIQLGLSRFHWSIEEFILPF